MKDLTFLFFLLPAFLLMHTGCDLNEGPDIPSSDMKLNFTATYDGLPVVFGSGSHAYENGLKIQFTDFKLYLSDVTLVGANGKDETDLSEIRLLDFAGITTPAQAAVGIGFFGVGGVPVGNYTAFQFDFGVSPSLNKTRFSSSTYAGNHPLNNSSLHSALLKSYIFMRLSGSVDADNDGAFDDGNFNYETGTGDLYEENVRFSKAITVEDAEAYLQNFQIDLKKVLKKSAVATDIIATPTIDNSNLHTLGAALMENLKSAIELK